MPPSKFAEEEEEKLLSPWFHWCRHTGWGSRVGICWLHGSVGEIWNPPGSPGVQFGEMSQKCASRACKGGKSKDPSSSTLLSFSEYTPLLPMIDSLPQIPNPSWPEVETSVEPVPCTRSSGGGCKSSWEREECGWIEHDQVMKSKQQMKSFLQTVKSNPVLQQAAHTGVSACCILMG